MVGLPDINQQKQQEKAATEVEEKRHRCMMSYSPTRYLFVYLWL